MRVGRPGERPPVAGVLVIGWEKGFEACPTRPRARVPLWCVGGVWVRLLPRGGSRVTVWLISTH